MQTSAQKRHSGAMRPTSHGVDFAVFITVEANAAKPLLPRCMSAQGINHPGLVLGRLAGGIMLCLVLFLWAASAAVPVHHVTCSDADDARHECAITHFAAGNCEIPQPVPACQITLLGFLAVLVWRDETHPASPIFRLSPARAPPLSPP